MQFRIRSSSSMSSPKIIKLGGSYVNLAQIAYADFTPERGPSGTPPQVNNDPNYNPFEATRPTYSPGKPAEIHLTFSGGAERKYQGDEAIMIKTALDAEGTPQPA